MPVTQDQEEKHQRVTISVPPALARKIIAQRRAPRRINISHVCRVALEQAFAQEEQESTALLELLAEQ